ncbi:MAG TPA: tetratricopeptide repeat protein [Anaerolineales bacterium]|jgi:tetratricopeptide (TPR) repeat protein|nr:tetratricopeptide repeat protein [Anaerolineales bacterium]
MILYRPVSLQELQLIYDSGMKAFPARLPQQPIFYPVLQLEYARQVASSWNVKNGQFAGYVTQFKVEDEYIGQFEEHTVSGTQYQELWIPAEKVEEFNEHISGHIKVLEAYFEESFQGFVPEKFGLQGKNAVDQFSLLANSYLYKRMEFYLEIKRNHKAVFLNYPFWQIYKFKNPGLKEKILQAIKEAWLTSFPNIPLPPPVPEDPMPANQRGTPVQPLARVVPEEIMPEEETDPDFGLDPVDEEMPPQKQINASPIAEPNREESTSEDQPDAQAVDSVQEEATPEEERDTSVYAQRFVKSVREDRSRIQHTASWFSRGIELGLSGKYREAIAELSKAVEEDPNLVFARTSLGVAFHRLGDEDRALSCYEAALRIDPIYAEAHYFRANILYKQGEVHEAIAGYTVAVGLNPALIEAHQTPAPEDRLTDYNPALTEMYWVAKPARRILQLNKLLETNPRQASLFKERATEYFRLRNYVQAIADYSSYLEIQSNDATVFHLRGVAYEQLGQMDHAQEDYERASAINPQLADEHIQRGVTFGQMGHFRQSIASLTEAIRLSPRNADSYFNRGTAYLQQGDFESAIADFSNVIQLSPGDEEAYYWRGISYEGARRQDRAIADYRQFLAISKDSQARKEIEGKLSQWTEGKLNDLTRRVARSGNREATNQIASKKTNRTQDLYDLLTALGERASSSTWLGSGVSCYGESAEELLSRTEQDQPIEGQDFLRITSRIRQTVEGDFTGFDPGGDSHWIFIRAWNGSGFYIETNDPKVREQLRTRFPSVQEVEGAYPPYEGLFLPIEADR